MPQDEHSKISRQFIRDFPEFVSMVKALDLYLKCDGGKRVSGMPVYWLDGQYQLTGYKFDQHGNPFTREIAATHINKILLEICEGRADVADETLEQRFERIVDGLKTIELRRGNFCCYRHPSGDHGSILCTRGEPVIASVYLWSDSRPIAETNWVMSNHVSEVLRASFANGGRAMGWPLVAITPSTDDGTKPPLSPEPNPLRTT